MEETLKTIRSTHRLVIIAATVLLVYNLSSRRDENHFLNSYQEIVQAKKDLINLTKIQDSSIRASVMGKPGVARLRIWAAEFLEHDSLPVFIRFDDELGVRRLFDGSLEDVLNFFAFPMGPNLASMDEPELRIYQFMLNVKDLKTDYDLRDIYIEVGNDSVNAILEYSKNYEPSKTFVLRYLISNPKDKFSDNAPAMAVFNKARKLKFVHWDDATNRWITLLHTRKIFTSVKDIPYNFLEETLALKSEEFETEHAENVEVAGIKMPTEFVLFGGPLVLLFLLVELLLQLIHLNRIKTESDDSELRKFPWLGTIAHPSAFSLTFISFIVLVPAACIIAVIKSHYPVWIIVTITTVYLAILWVLGFVILIQISDLRRALYGQAESVATPKHYHTDEGHPI